MPYHCGEPAGVRHVPRHVGGRQELDMYIMLGNRWELDMYHIMLGNQWELDMYHILLGAGRS